MNLNFKYIFHVGFVIVLAFSVPAQSQEPYYIRLSLPVDCKHNLRENCAISKYFDRSFYEKEPHNFTCGKLTGKGFRGTEFSFRNTSETGDDIPVKAAAPGMITFFDNVEPLVPKKERCGKEFLCNCDNGVRITHAHGWETIYCNLRQGSNIHKRFDTVHPGDVLGYVDQSDTDTPKFTFYVYLQPGHIEWVDGFQDPFARKDHSCLEANNEPIQNGWERNTVNLWDAFYLEDVMYQIGKQIQ